jgi:hypothetical protein
MAKPRFIGAATPTYPFVFAGYERVTRHLKDAQS